ncbi:CCA tRNA nucleotidyltransferase [Clostridium oryzae]|uniref:CCA-adding enzyme n=1 Tax=Clostridium oryzae TaxID=1450648 RepID=A0A1V4IC01_9CLOT|nr:HDIG domain-containing metalloprotein [Clostridium oryzae]OPJ57476.1 CCA-adding enzyme [Clostridium oryzae]
MEIKIPQKVNYIIDELKTSGFQAYTVGGCVRDCFLDRMPNDWDITTEALPEDIIKIFPHTIPTGIKHGTISVMIDNELFEVTTYRIDGEYSDNRHPDSVVFTDNIVDDLSRRDFTINAMAYNESNGLVDPFNGLNDLNNKLIMAVGNADNRFNEDALRMIRAIRFSCQLDFRIHDDTFLAIQNNCGLIQNVSAERIREEFCKILLCKVPSKGIENLRISGLLQYIIPEILPMVGFNQKNPHHTMDVYTHTMTVLDNTEADLSLRLSALFHDIGKPSTFSIDKKNIGHFYGHEYKGMDLAEKILKRLKFDNNTIKKVSILIHYHMTRYNKFKMSGIKKLITKVEKENLDVLFSLQVADVKGSAPPYDFSGINDMKTKINKILEEHQPICLKDLNINGNDLIKLGVKPGKDVGIVLNKLLDLVLEDSKLNEFHTLKDAALKILNKDSI